MAISKKLDIQKNIDSVKTWAAEVDILIKLRGHPNIITIVNHYFEPQNGIAVITTEDEEANDLSKEIRARAIAQDPFTEDQIWLVMAQASHALYTAHSKNIYHHDLGPKSILYKKENNHIKVCDFINPKVSFPCYSEPSGKEPYQCPEIKGDEIKDAAKCDVWSIGAIGFELVSGEPPASLLKQPESK